MTKKESRDIESLRRALIDTIHKANVTNIVATATLIELSVDMGMYLGSGAGDRPMAEARSRCVDMISCGVNAVMLKKWGRAK